jgi:hypothetical protein
MPAKADDESNGGSEEGVLGDMKSIFAPNEKTKAGKVLPKVYLKGAREVVRTLRESLEEDSGSRWRRRTAATWPSSAGTPMLPRGPSGSSWAGGEASRSSSPRYATPA